MLTNNKWPPYPQTQTAPISTMPYPQTQTMPISTMPYPQTQMMPISTMPSANMMPSTMVQGAYASGFPTAPGGMSFPSQQEESYVENILRMNLGKVATLYMTYENNTEWNAKIFKGVLEAAGRDHIIISDPVTGKRYLLLTLNLDYITFDEQINYTLPFGTMPSTR